MEHFQAIYASRAAEYHQMIAAEDLEGRLLPAIERVTSLRGKRVIDLGTGTGRLPLLIGGQAAQLVGLDLHRDMLRQHVAQRQRQAGRWAVVQGDMRYLPFRSAWADVVTAEWAIGHMRSWFAGNWQTQIGSVLDEMHARTEFFFGPDLVAKIRAQGWARLPEWTGVWSKPIST